MSFRLERQLSFLAAASWLDIYLKNMLVLPHVKKNKSTYRDLVLHACPIIFNTVLSSRLSRLPLLSSLQTVTLPDLDSLIRLACSPSLADTDLGLGFLSLGGVLVAGSFTVRAVVFTVVVGCPGVCHYQKLLDVALKGR